MVEDKTVRSADVIPLFPPDATQLASPVESLRLIRAFLAIKDPAQRLGVVEHVERVAEQNGNLPI